MAPSIISLIALFLIFLSAISGMFIQNIVPEHHLSEDSKNIVKAARGVVVGLAALTLGLLIATAKGSFDTKGSELKTSAAKTIVLNRILLNFGDKSKPARDALKNVTESGIQVIDDINKNGVVSKTAGGIGLDILQKRLLELPDDTPNFNWLKNTALTLGNDIAIARWKIYENSTASVSPLFIVILIFWLMVIFFSLGLIAPVNAMVLTALFMAAVSMTGAILLTLELDQPYGGLIQFSTDPLKLALKQFM